MMTELEQEVSEAIAADTNYPLGEKDAMKWAVAWRHIRDRNGIDANASQAEGDIDGWMVGWFACCMATNTTAPIIADLSEAIEDAFRAGFRSCVGRPIATEDDDPKAEDDAWCEYEACLSAISLAQSEQLAERDARIAEIENLVMLLEAERDNAYALLAIKDAKIAALREVGGKIAGLLAKFGFRKLVAGWNGEDRVDGPYDPHPRKLGITLRTDAGTVYDLDAALTAWEAQP